MKPGEVLAVRTEGALQNTPRALMLYARCPRCGLAQWWHLVENFGVKSHLRPCTGCHIPARVAVVVEGSPKVYASQATVPPDHSQGEG